MTPRQDHRPLSAAVAVAIVLALVWALGLVGGLSSAAVHSQLASAVQVEP